jgi:thiamine-phosphate pyrophosphorylase
MYQLREKELTARHLYTLAAEMKSILSTSGSMLLMNERLDIALASGSDGVHLPESSCPADSIRRKSPGLLFGQSVHSLATALQAEKAGVEYLLFGPVFATPSKERYGPPQGLDALETLCRSVTIPVYAVGGIMPERACACIEKGAYGIAALGAFLDTRSLPATVNHFRSFIPS